MSPWTFVASSCLSEAACPLCSVEYCFSMHRINVADDDAEHPIAETAGPDLQREDHMSKNGAKATAFYFARQHRVTATKEGKITEKSGEQAKGADQEKE